MHGLWGLREARRPIVAVTEPRSPATGRTPSAGPDKDCLNFDTQRQARRYFESKGGPGSDPDRLDADHDGIACQSLPG